MQGGNENPSDELKDDEAVGVHPDRQGDEPTDEQLGGPGSKEEAVEWIRRVPNVTGQESEIEIRQVFDIEDFGAKRLQYLQRRSVAIVTRIHFGSQGLKLSARNTSAPTHGTRTAQAG